ncbi:hypothetical protein DJ564_05625 [Pseudomonas sp. 31-12]|nr:hypothetical protein DJ564_05625 [Pseudomonas sp. 31-12]
MCLQKNAVNLWERACPRWRWVRRRKCLMINRYRGQARSHRMCVNFNAQASFFRHASSISSPSSSTDASVVNGANSRMM